jgi:hypothetical protein
MTTGLRLLPMTMMTDGVQSQGEGRESAESGAPLAAMWGEAVVPGFTAIPNVLLIYFRLLHVTPLEFLVLLNIVAHWWSADEHPYPRVTTLARRCGASTRSVQRSLNRLRTLGLLDWEKVRVGSDGKVRASLSQPGVSRRRYNMERLVQRAKELAADRMLARDPPPGKGRQIAA